MKAKGNNFIIDPEPPRQFIKDLSDQDGALEASNIHGGFSMSLLAKQGHLIQNVSHSGLKFPSSFFSTKFN